MIQCIVCGSTDNKPLYSGILKCQHCGHVFANIEMADGDIFDLYQKDYFFGSEYSNYMDDKDVLQKNFELRFNVLEKFLIPHTHENLFEIGSAYGFFLEFAQSRFQNVQGIDITQEGVRYAQDTFNAMQFLVIS